MQKVYCIDIKLTALRDLECSNHYSTMALRNFELLGHFWNNKEKYKN